MWQEEVFQALDGIPGASAFFMYPDDWPSGTVITYSGLNDAPERFADDREYTALNTIKVDVWDKRAAQTRDIALQVIAALDAIGFARTYCADLYETQSRLHHKTMRFQRLEPRRKDDNKHA